MKKEIERKFLLKDLPILPKGFEFEIQHIDQYYYLVDDMWYRIRKIDSNKNSDFIFLHTLKTYIDEVCYEQEKLYENDEYLSLVKQIHSGQYDARYIAKTRYVIRTGIMADFEGEMKEIKWEIDVFNFNLIIAEIELPELNFEIEIPDFIKSKIICEVTGIKEFSNRLLAEPLNVTKNVTV